MPFTGYEGEFVVGVTGKKSNIVPYLTDAPCAVIAVSLSPAFAVGFKNRLAPAVKGIGGDVRSPLFRYRPPGIPVSCTVAVSVRFRVGCLLYNSTCSVIRIADCSFIGADAL